MTSMDDNQVYLSGSRESWTPTESTAFTPESIPGFVVNQAQVQASPQQQTFNQSMGNAGFPDLSSMMFPSGDPFAYPNQPISTLEDGQFKQEPGQFGFPGGNNMFFNEPTTTGISFENFDAPIYGGPYMIQPAGQAQMGNSNFQPPMEWGGNDMARAQQRWQSKQHSMPPGMNLNEILGSEEWNAGWLDPNYRQ
jgi:hypothetical protein